MYGHLVVLIYDRVSSDPRIAGLDDHAHMVWIAAIGTCNRLGRDTIAIEELEPADSAVLDQLVNAELAERVPGEHLRLLARLDLWAFDDDDVVW
jgi:hypothetical protein